MVGRRGETPLVPPYRFRSSNKAMALTAFGGIRDARLHLRASDTRTFVSILQTRH